MKNPQDTGLHPEQPDMPSRESPSSSTSASFTISPSLLNKLVHFAHDAILVRDLEGHIIFWNEGAEHLYGWTAQEVLNKITHTLLQTHFPISLDDLNQTLEQHGKWEGNLIHYRRDGAQVIVESRQVLVRDEEGKPSAILEINRDITERHGLQQLEEEARAEREARLNVLQLVLDRLPGGIFLVQGPHLCLLMANQAATALWGAEWQRGQPEEEFFQQQGIQRFTTNGQLLPRDEWAARQAMASGEPVHQQLVLGYPDGTHQPVLVEALPLANLSLLSRLPQEMATLLPPAAPVILIVYQDVSTLKDAEKLKDQFISLATHELLTPVTIIAGYADRLLSHSAQQHEHQLDEWQHEKVQEIKQAAWQLTSLTENLLDVTRMQAGLFELEQRSTDLPVLAGRVIKRLQTTTTLHQLIFQTTLAHLWAMVDVLRIEQVLSNLLSNAIKYSPRGGPIEIILEADQRMHEARFQIHDQGMGIPLNQQAHLFGRFARAENVRAAGIRGTGLGLYLCRELVERQGGHISFESAEGAGSTFFFSLPYQKIET